MLLSVFSVRVQEEEVGLYLHCYKGRPHHTEQFGRFGLLLRRQKMSFWHYRKHWFPSRPMSATLEIIDVDHVSNDVAGRRQGPYKECMYC